MSSTTANWQAKRFKEAKLRSRQSLAKKQKENEVVKTSSGSVNKGVHMTDTSSTNKSSSRDRDSLMSIKIGDAIDNIRQGHIGTETKRNHIISPSSSGSVLKDIKNSRDSRQSSNIDHSHHRLDNSDNDIPMNSRISSAAMTATATKMKEEMKHDTTDNIQKFDGQKISNDNKMVGQVDDCNNYGDINYNFMEFMDEMKREITSDHVEVSRKYTQKMKLYSLEHID